jgi:hypothetical protein
VKKVLLERADTREFHKIVDTDQPGTGAAIRKALGLGPEASDADCVAAIEKKKSDAAYAKMMTEYRASAEYKKSIAEREARKTTASLARSYMKQSAAELFEARQRDLEQSVRKLSSQDVGTADIRPRTVSGNDAVVNLVENPKSAYD